VIFNGGILAASGHHVVDLQAQGTLLSTNAFIEQALIHWIAEHLSIPIGTCNINAHDTVSKEEMSSCSDLSCFLIALSFYNSESHFSFT